MHFWAINRPSFSQPARTLFLEEAVGSKVVRTGPSSMFGVCKQYVCGMMTGMLEFQRTSNFEKYNVMAFLQPHMFSVLCSVAQVSTSG